MTSLVARALVSGTLAAVATTAAVAVAGRRTAGSYAAPVNATSHALWGETAEHENKFTFKYTATGLALNHGASVFWALFYEEFAGPRPSRKRALLGGALVSAVAYVVDYHLVPPRLTPGFETRLPRKALGATYAALAAGLCIRDLLKR
ncbi:MAG TPA: hypothetical protein VF268_03560 [Gammaproteobacteria bacterium]